MSIPKVSVLMAVYNGGEDLLPSLESIATQSFKDWEMVVVDDASTDATREIVQGFAARDGRVRLVKNEENKGQTACLNQGLRECQGEWVARQDADDVSCPSRLAAQVEYMQRNQGTVLLGTQGVLIDGEGRRIGLLDVPCGGRGIMWASPFVNPFIHTAVMFHRDVVAAGGGYDETFRIAQDYELWTRLAAEGRTANLQERMVGYRHAETSLSKTGSGVAFAEADRVSAREVKRWLGRDWQGGEERLVGDFRRGLASLDHQAFWIMVRLIEEECGVPMPTNLRAAWHLRMAGANRHAALGQMAAAFRVSPRFTMRWVRDRWFRRGKCDRGGRSKTR